MKNIVIGKARGIPVHKLPVEMVERKGIGHPDTLIDGIMENVSRRLSKEYLRKYGRIRHHNVDKGLICGGATEVEFGGGRFTKPIRILLSGRAFGEVPVDEIAREAAIEHLRRNVRNLSIDEGIVIQSLITEIWPKWDELSKRATVPLANDTSFGVGYAPLTQTEQLVLEIERFLNSDKFKTRYPWVGEDIKVMGLRNEDEIEITMAIAMVSRHIKSLDDYVEAKRIVEREALAFASTLTSTKVTVKVNNADNEETGSIYLTLSGTSTEMGDDGSVGRGNRVNGLITPFRPMTLEAFAGKNPVSHTGKLYSVLAFEIAEAIIQEFPEIEGVEVYLLSRIGNPIDAPSNISILATADEQYLRSVKEKIQELIEGKLSRITELTSSIVTSSFS